MPIVRKTILGSSLSSPRLPPAMTSDPMNGGSHDDRQVSQEVMDLLLLSCSNGLGALINALARNGLLLPLQIDAIHRVTSPPLDHAELWADEDLAFIRQAWDDELSRARGAALQACQADEPNDED